MKIERIINDLLSRDINKYEALNKIKEITDGLRNKASFEFVIEEVGFTVEQNHCYMKIKLPYGYNEVGNKFNKGDKIDVIQIP